MMDPAIFRPADGYEVPDAAAILSLRGTRHKNIWLSPTQLSQMTLADVKGILAEYGEAFDACIEEAMDGHDPDLIGSTTVCLAFTLRTDALATSIEFTLFAKKILFLVPCLVLKTRTFAFTHGSHSL